jgi:hypothetical protein
LKFVGNIDYRQIKWNFTSDLTQRSTLVDASASNHDRGAASGANPEIISIARYASLNLAYHIQTSAQ